MLFSSEIITSTDSQVKMHQTAWMWPTVRLRKTTYDLVSRVSAMHRAKKKMKLGWIFPQQPQQGQARGTLIFFILLKKKCFQGKSEYVVLTKHNPGKLRNNCASVVWHIQCWQQGAFSSQTTPSMVLVAKSVRQVNRFLCILGLE